MVEVQKWSDSGSNLKVQPKRFLGGLNVSCKEFKDDTVVSGTYKWRDGGARNWDAVAELGLKLISQFLLTPRIISLPLEIIMGRCANIHIILITFNHIYNINNFSVLFYLPASLGKSILPNISHFLNIIILCWIIFFVDVYFGKWSGMQSAKE